MHLCRNNLRFVGFGYKIINPKQITHDLGFKTFDLYICNKCKKLVYKEEDCFYYDSDEEDKMNEQLKKIRELGSLSLKELTPLINEICGGMKNEY